MDKTEFFEIITFLSHGCGKSLTREGTEVYYRMLGDLPASVLWAAAEQALLEPLYSAFPSIALLRRLAVESSSPAATLTAGEAWMLARMASQRFADPHLDTVTKRGVVYTPHEWNEMILNGLPPNIAHALRCFGFCSLNDNETCRAQFRDFYSAIATREHKAKALPPSLVKALTSIKHENGVIEAQGVFRCKILAIEEARKTGEQEKESA